MHYQNISIILMHTWDLFPVWVLSGSRILGNGLSSSENVFNYNHLLKNGLGSQVIVFKLQYCIPLPRTSRILYYGQLAKLVASFIYMYRPSECCSPKGTSTRGH